MFRFVLLDEHGEPLDPVAFISAVPNWTVGETFSLGSGERFRILEIRTELDLTLVDAGFNAIFVVEAV